MTAAGTRVSLLSSGMTFPYASFPSAGFLKSISFVLFVPFVVHGFGFAHFVNHCEVGYSLDNFDFASVAR